jgi:hypothetical protein
VYKRQAFCTFFEVTPEWLNDVCADKLKQESKMSPAERLAR